MVWVMGAVWVALVAFVAVRSRTLVWFTRPYEVPPPLRAIQVVEPTAVLPPNRRELEQ
jgi:hypothetical protein